MRSFHILILCCLVSGCAHRVALRSDSPSEDFAKANRAFRSLHCQIQLAGTTLVGQSQVHLGNDTIRWNDTVTEQPDYALFHEVRSIKAISHKRGAIPGALLGLLGGAVMGYVVSHAYYRSTVPSTEGFGIAFGDIGGAIAIGFGIGAAGTILGANVGHAVGVPVEVYNDAYLDINSPLRSR